MGYFFKAIFKGRAPTDEDELLIVLMTFKTHSLSFKHILYVCCLLEQIFAEY
jgi:hypothetical protein